MKFNIIDKDNWQRKECFEHFMNIANCSYSITVKVDITKLYSYIKENNLRFYPAFTWAISKCINNQKELRMGYDQDGNLGYFDKVNPSYSVLNETTKIMSDLCSEYEDSFSEFYKSMTTSLDNYKKDSKYTTPFTPNFFIVSCLPWIDYSAFNVNNHGSEPFLFPMVTWGKFISENNNIYISVTIQVHHAVADGYHCSVFFNDLERIVNNPTEFLFL